jgi:hypothetical protein
MEPPLLARRLLRLARTDAARDAVLLVEPLAEVGEAAALGAEREVPRQRLRVVDFALAAAAGTGDAELRQRQSFFDASFFGFASDDFDSDFGSGLASDLVSAFGGSSFFVGSSLFEDGPPRLAL